MQSIAVFFDIAKFIDFRLKHADVSRTQGVCHLIHIFFGSSLGKVYCAKFHHCRIFLKDFRESTQSRTNKRIATLTYATVTEWLLKFMIAIP